MRAWIDNGLRRVGAEEMTGEADAGAAVPMTGLRVLAAPAADTAGALPAIALVAMVVAAAGVWVWMSLALSALFRKTMRDPRLAWVPVANHWVLFELAGMRGWWAAVLAGGALVVGVTAGVLSIALGSSALTASFGGEAAAAQSLLTASVMVPALLWLLVLVPAVILQALMLVRIGRGFDLPGAFVVLGIVCLPAWASVVGWGRREWLPPGAPGRAEGRSQGRAEGRARARSQGATSVQVPAAPVAPVIPPLADFAAKPTAAPAFSHVPVFGGGHATPPGGPSVFAPPSGVADSATTARPGADAFTATPARPSFAPPAATPDAVDEHTVIAPPRAPGWSLRLPGGETIALTSDAAVLGRNPVAPPHAPGAQVVAVIDLTRTMSKTHALLTRTATGWTVTDLASTNGVRVGATLETAAEVDGSAPVGGTFFLGDAQLSLRAGS